jgi:hypothetical protein
LLLTGAAHADDNAAVARQALAKLPGFDATYVAESSSGKKFTIHVRCRRPDKMRVDVDPMNVTSLFDGARYVAFDRENSQALALTAAAMRDELRRIDAAARQVTWAAAPATDYGEMIHPNLTIAVGADRLDVSLEMAMAAERHSWLIGLDQAAPVERRGDRAEFVDSRSGVPVRTTVNLTTGLLERLELHADDEVKTVVLQSVSLEAPAEDAFKLTLPPEAESRAAQSDPTLLQQLDAAAWTGHLQRILSTARGKWESLGAEEKDQLRRAGYEAFARIVGLGREAMTAGLQQSMRESQIAAKVIQAAKDPQAKAKFAADYKDLHGRALDAAWKKQVADEATRALVMDVLRSVDQRFAEPLRQQALEATAGMKDEPRRELIDAVTEPVLRAFGEIAKPVVEEGVRAALK